MDERHTLCVSAPLYFRRFGADSLARGPCFWSYWWTRRPPAALSSVNFVSRCSVTLSIEPSLETAYTLEARRQRECGAMATVASGSGGDTEGGSGRQRPERARAVEEAGWGETHPHVRTNSEFKPRLLGLRRSEAGSTSWDRWSRCLIRRRRGARPPDASALPSFDPDSHGGPIAQASGCHEQNKEMNQSIWRFQCPISYCKANAAKT